MSNITMPREVVEQVLADWYAYATAAPQNDAIEALEWGAMHKLRTALSAAAEPVRDIWHPGLSPQELRDTAFPSPAPAVPDAAKPELSSLDLEAIIDNYLEGYELRDDPACHTPSDFERLLIKDAIMGLLVDEDWDSAWGAHIASISAERAAKPETHPDLPECKHNAHGWEPETQGEQTEQATDWYPGITEKHYDRAISKAVRAALLAAPVHVEPLTPEIIDRAGREWWAQTRHTNGPRVLKEYAGEAIMREVYETARIILEAAHGIGKDQAS